MSERKTHSHDVNRPAFTLISQDPSQHELLEHPARYVATVDGRYLGLPSMLQAETLHALLMARPHPVTTEDLVNWINNRVYGESGETRVDRSSVSYNIGQLRWNLHLATGEYMIRTRPKKGFALIDPNHRIAWVGPI